MSARLVPDRSGPRAAVAAVLAGCLLSLTFAGPVRPAIGAPSAPVLTRVAGADRYATAAAVATATFDHADHAVLANGERALDALTGAGLAGASGPGPVLLTAADRLLPATREALVALHVSSVTLIGDERALSPAVASAVSDLGITVERAAGSDVYSSAAAVAAACAAPCSFGRLNGLRVALLAGASGLPDALAAGPLAAKLPAPLLLTDRDSVPEATAAALGDVDQVLVLGGTAAVSDAVVDALRGRGLAVRRLAGADRQRTAAALADFEVAELGFPGDRVLVARGSSAADALSAGPRGAALAAPVLLTADATLGEAARTWIAAHAVAVTSVDIMGGRAAVAPVVADEALRATSASAAFVGSVSTLDDGTRARVQERSWRPGCPVPLTDLRLLHFDIVGFDGAPHRGEMIVAAPYAAGVLGVFQKMYDARFPVRSARLVDNLELADLPSDVGDNSAALNCRPMTGSSSGFSEHSYGRAVDINPLENPYLKSGVVSPPEGATFLDRSQRRPGMITSDDVVTRSFAGLGWGWGGSWQSLKDYMHFSATGR